MEFIKILISLKVIAVGNIYFFGKNKVEAAPILSPES